MGERREPAPLSSSSAPEDETIFAAICENKAREVGLAVFEVGTAVLHLQQYVENSFTYSISL